jgi:hypothetical protein
METIFKIVVNMRTLEGMAEIGNFFVGNETEFAENMFSSLKGNPVLPGDTKLRLDLIRKEEFLLPVCLKSICCTLDEYAENCKLIARDVFKYFTLEDK